MTFDMLRTRTPLEWAMIAVGVVVLGLGVYVLRANRFRGKRLADDSTLLANLPLVGEVSEPTRLTLAFGIALLGYHLVIWAFPTHATPLQFSREYWWVVVVATVVGIGASVMLDRREQRTPD